jgi:hypothetical protein
MTIRDLEVTVGKLRKIFGFLDHVTGYSERRQFSAFKVVENRSDCVFVVLTVTSKVKEVTWHMRTSRLAGKQTREERPWLPRAKIRPAKRGPDFA